MVDPMGEADYQARQRLAVELCRQAGLRQRARRIGLPDPAHTLDWTALWAKYPPHPGTAAAHHFGGRFLAAVQEGRLPRCGFGVWGKQGTGKTTLLQALALSLEPLGFSVSYVSLPEFQDERFDREKDGWIYGALQELGTPSILILDEFAQETPYPTWVDRFLAPLVNVRYSRGLPTLYGSTFDLAELPARWSGIERAASIQSRLTQRNGSWVEMVANHPGGDYRQPELDF